MSLSRWTCLVGALFLWSGVNLLATGCSGSGDVEAPVVVEATPTPAPLLPAEPATLFHLQVVEGIKAPPGPLWSPFDRDLPAIPDGGPDAGFLHADGADDEVVARVEAWQQGGFPSGANLLLVEWSLRWGRDGLAGEGRRWGACVLPCRIKDGFFATAKHHPADPLRNALVLFAGRPGAADLVVSRDPDGLVVKHGDALLWAAGAAGSVVRKKEQVVGMLRAADGSDGAARRLWNMRTLRVADVQRSTLPAGDDTERFRAADALVSRPEDSIRVLPELTIPGPDELPHHRAIEGEVRYWPWLEANQFEGGFAIRPDPGLEGLTVQRQEQRVEWVPTARQAGEGRVDFVTYSLARAGVTAIITPFPGGAEVLSATPGLDNRLLVAALGGDEAVARAHGVVREFERFQSIFPLPDELGDPPILVYLSEDPAIVVPATSGGSRPAFVVSSRSGEGRSLASAWARMVLGKGATQRTVEVRDFVSWLRPQLLDGPDRARWTPVFAAAGDDVLEVWLQGLRGGGDTATLAGFLDYVDRKIPSLAVQLRRGLAVRDATVDPMPAPSVLEVGDVEKRSVEAKGPVASQVLAVQVPPSGELEVRVLPEDKALLRASVAMVSLERWNAGQDVGAAQGELAGQWADDLSTAGGPDSPLTWNSPPAAEASSDGAPVPRVVMLLLWGPAAWKATVEVAHVPVPDDAGADTPKQ